MWPIEAGEASLLAGRIPVLLASCHRPTAAIGLAIRSQRRLAFWPPGDPGGAGTGRPGQ